MTTARDFNGSLLCIGDKVIFTVDSYDKSRLCLGTITSLHEDTCVIEYEDGIGSSRKANRQCCNVVLKRNV